MRLNNINAIIYYANKCINLNLSKRELKCLIKLKEYERLAENTKEKLKAEKEITLKETITDPIIISNLENKQIIKEKELQRLIIENYQNFLREL